ncbi:MAG: PqqD family protein [Pseudomonadota bacterium]
MENFLSLKLAPPSTVLMRELAGDAVILDMEKETYFGLDPVATRMWTCLCESTSVAAALHTLQEEFDVEPARLSEDLQAFIEKMRRLGLLRVAGE